MPGFPELSRDAADDLQPQVTFPQSTAQTTFTELVRELKELSMLLGRRQGVQRLVAAGVFQGVCVET